MTAKIFRFVRHENSAAYIELGWVNHNSLVGTHHGQYSTLLEWPFPDIPPTEPKEIALAG